MSTALTLGGDEPHAHTLAESIVAARTAQPIETTRQLRDVVDAALPERTSEVDRKATAARVFQAIRIAVNEEFTALDTFLQKLPHCLLPGGKVAILSFHSGEYRRVKHHLREGFRCGIYSEISQEIIRPSPKEIGENSRAASAKMRWAIRAVSG